jgi:hypothetical protein
MTVRNQLESLPQSLEFCTQNEAGDYVKWFYVKWFVEHAFVLLPTARNRGAAPRELSTIPTAPATGSVLDRTRRAEVEEPTVQQLAASA